MSKVPKYICHAQKGHLTNLGGSTTGVMKLHWESELPQSDRSASYVCFSTEGFQAARTLLGLKPWESELKIAREYLKKMFDEGIDTEAVFLTSEGPSKVFFNQCVIKDVRDTPPF